MENRDLNRLKVVLAEKKRTTPDEKRSSAAEKAARLARLNGGFATPDQLWGEFENSAEFKAVDKAMKN